MFIMFCFCLFCLFLLRIVSLVRLLTIGDIYYQKIYDNETIDAIQLAPLTVLHIDRFDHYGRTGSFDTNA